MSLDADAASVHGLVGLEIVHDTADAPGPGADRTPFVRGRRRLLRLQGQSDDAFLERVGAVRLNVVVADAGVGPTAAEDLSRNRLLAAEFLPFSGAAPEG